MIHPFKKIRAGLVAHPVGQFVRERIVREKIGDASGEQFFRREGQRPVKTFRVVGSGCGRTAVRFCRADHKFKVVDFSSSSTKLDALGERQFGGIIHRDGLAAHVSFPAVAAAFASAAGVFLAAERAADLRAARADVHVGDAAIAAGRGDKLLGLAHFIRENCGAQTLRHGVVLLNCTFQIAIRNQIQDRRKRFFANNLETAARGGEARTNVASAGKFRAPQFFAAVNNFPARALQTFNRILHRRHGPFMDDRSHQNARFQRVADGNL